jgi:glycosyltransferase involved in cell wall biosynthesis
MKKVSAIICVYNEEKTLRNVVLSVFEDHNVNEIIVINDGSSDNSKKIIEELKDEMEIKAIHFDENKGKGYAMAIGVENAKNDIIVFIDADQTKIISGYIEQMISLLVQDNNDMVLGYITKRIGWFDINPIKILTGERVLFKKDIIPILDKMKESRFGVETLLYLHYASMDKKIKYTKLMGLKHKDKYKKASFINASLRYIKEGWEIVFTAMKNYDLMLKLVVLSLRNKPV